MSNDKYALITGASSGIGYELTKQFAKNGYNLVIVARSQDRLEEIARDWTSKYGVKVMPLPKDLFDPSAPQQIYDEVKQWGIHIDVLVNDAGQGVYGLFHETGINRETDIIQLNIISLVTLTKLFLKDMIANKEGKILNLASMVSKMPSPLMAVYSATKAFVYSFTESLVNELQDTGVTITAILPGATATDFFHKANAENTVAYQGANLDDPEDVAIEGYEAVMKGASRVIPGFRNKLDIMMSNLTPDTVLANNMRQQMNEKKEDEDNKDENGEINNKAGKNVEGISNKSGEQKHRQKKNSPENTGLANIENAPQPPATKDV